MCIRDSYIIEPPEGSQIDTGYVAEDPVDEAEAEREAMAVMVTVQESFAESLQEELETSEFLTDEERAALQEQLDSVLASIAQMYETLGVDADEVGEVATAYVATPAAASAE